MNRELHEPELPGALFTRQSLRVWVQLLLPPTEQGKDLSELLLGAGSLQLPPIPFQPLPTPPTPGEPVKGPVSLNVGTFEWHT